jgi:hypothetical protein
MRDWPSRVISCSSFTDNSSRSNNAMMRRRVGSESARNDFNVPDIFCVLLTSSATFINTGLQPGERMTLNPKNRFNGFPPAREAVKTVRISWSPPTPG